MKDERIALPKEFVQRVQNDSFLGKNLVEALDTKAPVSLRVHPVKGSTLFSDSAKIPWSENGKWLTERPVFTLDPHFHAGAYYPQEAGSQLLDFVLKNIDLPEEPIMLDLCAAPGGKSTLILDYLDGKGLLLSNEIIPNRARILYENITKWGAANSVISNNAPEAFRKFNSFFDCIVTDVPCSGEGMFRKDPESRLEWSESNVEMCAGRQRDIIEDCWDSLKTGGFLIYSTCTFNSLENEDNIAWICEELGAEYVSIDFPDLFKSRNGIGVYALPGKVDTEGFYIAVLRKTAESRPSKKKNKPTLVQEIIGDKELSSVLKNSEAHIPVLWKEKAWLIPASKQTEIQELIHSLSVFKIGITLAEPARKGWIWNEGFAFAPEFISENVPRITLTKQEALQYLKGETFLLEPGNGYALVQFEGSTLGWIKRIDKRFNNCYPKEWRIRMKID